MEPNTTNQQPPNPKMDPNYDPEVGGTKCQFIESPFYKSPLSMVRHPIMFSANSTGKMIAEHFFGWLFITAILSEDMLDVNIPWEIASFLYDFIGNGGANLVYGALIIFGRICSWFAFIIAIGFICAKVFGGGKFKHSKEWYLENYAAWYAGHPESPIFAEKKETLKREEPVQEGEARFCRHCGSPIKPSMRFCINCGKPL